MRIVRYLGSDGSINWGEEFPGGEIHRLEGTTVMALKRTGVEAKCRQLLAPIQPTAILCIGLNYRRHAEETRAAIPKFPVLFMKGINAVLDPGKAILIPQALLSRKVDYECELAVVIGKSCKNVSRENAMEYIAGFTAANDVSARDWQKEGGGTQWCRGKTFDTFAPMGPALVTPDEIPNVQDLRIRTIVNGEVLQDCSTADMIFDVPTLIEFLSASTTLLPGTAILTGTPHGVGMARDPQRFLQPGDNVTIEIDRIGSLTNSVELEAASTNRHFSLSVG
jgi:2-keto-4-pentenoate hydratase/2-oxohepta-3-ene-1,7-dioic acid hydratase in catechol pathway